MRLIHLKLFVVQLQAELQVELEKCLTMRKVKALIGKMWVLV